MTANWPCLGSGLTSSEIQAALLAAAIGRSQPHIAGISGPSHASRAGRTSARSPAGSAASSSATVAAEQRVAPVRRDLGERHEDEGALLQPRVRQDQPRRRSPSAPSPVRAIQPRDGGAVGPDGAAAGEEVEIADPRPPAAGRGAARAPPRRRASAASTASGGRAPARRGGAVDVVRARPGREGRRPIPAAPRRHREPARRRASASAASSVARGPPAADGRLAPSATRCTASSPTVGHGNGAFAARRGGI